MAVITKITTQQKNKDRYNIFMDYGKGEEFAFSVDEDVLIKFQLKKGMELDEFSLTEINYQDDIRKAYNLAAAYLGARIRSQKEITEHLQKKEMEDPVINEVIHKLKLQKYIDDHQYAHAYVRTQINTTEKGPEVIKLELKDRGIDKGFIDDALGEYSFELQMEKALKLIGKYLPKNAKDSKKAIKLKLENLLVRKGYSFEVIHKALDQSDLDNQDQELDAIKIQGEKLDRKYSRYTGREYEMKMKQALYRKGFPFEMIEKYLSEKLQSENEDY